MALIEGVGDEVTFTFFALLVVFVMVLAWLSTRVNDDPWFRIIILDRRRIEEFIAWLRSRHPGTVRVQEVHIRQHVRPGGSSTEFQPVSAPESATLITSDSETQDTAVEHGTDAVTAGDSSSIPSYTPTGSSAKAQSNVTESSTNESQIASSAEEISSDDAPRLEERHEGDRTSDEPEALSHDLSNREPQTLDNDVTHGTISEEVTSQSTSQSQDTGHENITSNDGISDSTADDSIDGAAGREESVEECLPGHIRVKIKFLDEQQRMVIAKPEDTVADFKRKHFAAELAQDTVVRFIFRGQELRRESASLQNYHVGDNSVIHCLLSRAQGVNQPMAAQPRALDLDIGTLMFPLFGLILGLIWYCRFSYKQYFNAVSTLALMGITFLYLVAAMAAYRTAPPHQHED